MYEPMNDLSQQQPSLISYNVDSHILANQILDQEDQFALYSDVNFNNDIESLISDDPWDILINEFNTELFNENQFLEIVPAMSGLPISQNTFQQNLASTNLNHCQHFVQTSNLPLEPKTIDNAILTQSISIEDYQRNKNGLIPKTIKFNQNQSTSVTPIVYISDSNTYPSSNTTRMPSDILKSNKIQILCQPRSKFRPRTQNESKTSSHYIRCEDGAKLDYPAISVPQIWGRQSSINIIEVALTDVEKQPHPYLIDNKISKNSLEGEGLIWKENEPNVLYFRLTNEDFLAGYKTFMIELIKSKQDEVITKNLIRLRKLDQSMLCFTRIYRDENGDYQRDMDNQEYSCIMTENYGDVNVEHVGPRYGPMGGVELLFIAFKGRITKDDVSVIISEQTTSWCQKIEKFMINGNFIYFSMPAFPYSKMNRVNATVNIYFKNQKIHESTYLYTSLLDQELVNSNSDIDASMISNNLNHFHFDMLTDGCSVPLISQKTSKCKPKKRLNSK